MAEQRKFEDFQDDLTDKEAELEKQLDRIYQMVEEKKASSFLQIEYKRAVERMTEKYQILFGLLEFQKNDVDEAEYKEREKALQEQYKEDVVMLAVAIDEATGKGGAEPAKSDTT